MPRVGPTLKKKVKNSHEPSFSDFRANRRWQGLFDFFDFFGWTEFKPLRVTASQYKGGAEGAD